MQSPFEIGKTYNFTHTRKGNFTIAVTKQCDEWVTGIITDGKAKAMLDYNERFVGEEITVRKDFCKSITEVK